MWGVTKCVMVAYQVAKQEQCPPRVVTTVFLLQWTQQEHSGWPQLHDLQETNIILNLTVNVSYEYYCNIKPQWLSTCALDYKLR